MRTSTIQLRLPLGTKIMFERAAREAGLSLSAWVRVTLRSACKGKGKAA